MNLLCNSSRIDTKETSVSTTSNINEVINRTTPHFTDTLNSTTACINHTVHGSCNETVGNLDLESNTILPYIFTVAIIIAAVGSLANVFTIIVMLQKQSREMAVSRLIVVLAVSDSVNLWCASFNPEHILFNGIKIHTFIGCRIYFWFCLTFALLSHLVIMIISGERFVAVCFYAFASQINTIRNTNTAIIGVFCAAGSLVFMLQWNITSGDCILSNIINASRMTTIIYGLVYLLLPLPLLVIMNSATAFMLFFTKTGQMKYRNLTIMLLVTTVLYILLILPNSVANHQQFSTSKVLKEIAQLLVTINYAANFFIYVMVGKQFRRTVRGIFCRNGTIGPNTRSRDNNFGNSRTAVTIPMQMMHSSRPTTPHNES